MAQRPKSVCRKSGCGALVDIAGYCDKHKKESVGWNKTNTESSHARGYGAAWRKLRTIILRRDKGLCQTCMKQGSIKVAREVDHIISKAECERMGWTQERIDDESNLQAICVECHKAKTIEER